MVSKVFSNYFDIKEMVLYIHLRLCRSDLPAKWQKDNTLSNVNRVLSVFIISAFAAALKIEV